MYTNTGDKRADLDDTAWPESVRYAGNASIALPGCQLGLGKPECRPVYAGKQTGLDPAAPAPGMVLHAMVLHIGPRMVRTLPWILPWCSILRWS